MPTHLMICQFRLSAQWQLPSPPRRPPLPYSNGRRVEVAEAEEMEAGVAEAAEVVVEAAEEEVEEVEEVHQVDNLLPHLRPQCQLHLTMEGG